MTRRRGYLLAKLSQEVTFLLEIFNDKQAKLSQEVTFLLEIFNDKQAKLSQEVTFLLEIFNDKQHLHTVCCYSKSTDNVKRSITIGITSVQKYINGMQKQWNSTTIKPTH